MDRKTKIAIVGVGTAGSMALWQLAARGADVTGFETVSPGHSGGAAGGETRLFRVASEGAAYIPMTRRSLDLWRDLERETGQHLFDPCGGLTIGRPGSPAITHVEAMIEQFSIRHERLAAVALRARFPQLPVADDEIGILDLESGQVLAQASVAAAAGLAERLGAKIHRRTKITAVEPGPDGITLRAGDQAWLFDKVILSAGAWMNDFFPNDLPHLEVQRIAVHWYPLRSGEGLGPDRLPIIERPGPQYMVYIWPTVDDSSIKVALGHAIDHIDSPEGFSQDLPSSVIDIVDRAVAACLPAAIPVEMRRAICVDGHTADRDFLIGPLARDERIIIGAGFSGHGFKMCPDVGRTLADWATGAPVAEDMIPFAPKRFKGRNLLVHQALTI